MKSRIEWRAVPVPTPPPSQEKVLVVEMSLKEAALLRELVYTLNKENAYAIIRRAYPDTVGDCPRDDFMDPLCVPQTGRL